LSKPRDVVGIVCAVVHVDPRDVVAIAELVAMMPAKISTIMAHVAEVAAMQSATARYGMARSRRDADGRTRRKTVNPTTVGRHRTAAAESTRPGFGGRARRYEGKGGHKADDTRAIDHHTNSYAVQPHH
jgi:hypothetical protein